MTDSDPVAFEEGVIADMRAHGGEVTSGPLAGSPLLVLMSTGAKSGEPRRAILTFTRDADDYIVAGTKGGAPTDPAWIANLRAHSIVTVEVGGRTFGAKVSFAGGPDRDRLWDRHVSALPAFAEYPKMTSRVIPVVRLTPIG